MTIRQAQQKDLPGIALLHLFPYAEGRPLIGDKWVHRKHFYEDKNRALMHAEPEGMLIAESAGVTAGFLFVTTCPGDVFRRSMLTLPGLKMGLKTLLFMYGLDSGFLKWLFGAPLKILGNREVGNKKASQNDAGSTFCTTYGMEIPEKTACITNIVVHKRFRRKGVASKLIEAAEKYAQHKGATALTVTVSVDNRSAMSFYRSYGFEVSGELIKSYGQALLLKKPV